MLNAANLLLACCFTAAGIALADEPPVPVSRLGAKPIKQSTISLQFSPDGKLLAEARDDRSLTTWEVATGEPIFVRAHHSLPFMFTPDSKRLLTAHYNPKKSGSSELVALDARTGKQLSTVQMDLNFSYSIISPDGKLTATLESIPEPRQFLYAIAIYDTATGKRLRASAKSSSCPQEFRFSSDSKTLIGVTQDQFVRRWDVATMKEIGDSNKIEAGTWRAISPNGRVLVIGHGGAAVLDAETGKEILAPWARGWVPSRSAFSADGSVMAAEHGHGTIGVWRLATGKRLIDLQDETGYFGGLAISDDARYVAATSYQRPPRVWEVDTGRELPQFNIGHSQPIAQLAFSPDGKRLYSVNGRAGGRENPSYTFIRVWDTERARNIHTIIESKAICAPIALSPNGAKLAIGLVDGSFCVRDSKTGKEIQRTKGHTSWIAAIAFLDEDRLLTAGADDGLRCWSIGSDKATADHRVIIRSNPTAVRQVRRELNPVPDLPGHFWAFSGDGKYLASIVLEGGFWAAGNATDFLSGGKYVLHLIDTATGKEIRKWEVGVHEWGVGDVAFPRFFNQARSIHLNGKDGIQVFNTADGKKVSSIAAKSDFRVAVINATLGDWFVLAENDSYGKEGKAIVYDATGKRLVQFDGGQGAIWAMAVSPDRRLLATGGEDGTILFWKLPK